jgi:hypothetical protein
MEQRVPLGRPNRTDDGEPKLLAEALAASPVGTAYTRREPDEKHAYPRILAVNRAPSDQWRVIEWELKGDWSGMKLLITTQDRQDAEEYTTDTLTLPHTALWWPAVGGLSIQYSGDDYSTALAVD